MKFLLIHASLGWGHKRAAAAIEEELTARGIATEIVDMLDFLPAPLPRFYPWAYSFMITRARGLWRWFYNVNDRAKSPYSPATSTTQGWQFGRLQAHVEKSGCTHIVSTHFTAAALVTDWRRIHGWKQPAFSVVTDYISHRCWQRDGLDHYFVATSEVGEQLQQSGIPGGRITVSGIPISAMFSQSWNRADCRLSWGAGPDEILVLVLSSGLNEEKTRRMIEDLRQIPGKVRFLVSAGKHAPREQLVREYSRGDDRFLIFGFSARIAEMMAAADLLVSKPGGLTTSEAMASGLPQVLFSPIPGQEEANADYVTRHGAGLCIEAERGAFRDTLQSLLSDPERLPEMARRARELGRPHAARQICDILLQPVFLR